MRKRKIGMLQNRLFHLTLQRIYAECTLALRRHSELALSNWGFSCGSCWEARCGHGSCCHGAHLV